ncbi:MAG: carbon-nitrogen hydrolase [bacterium]
MSETKKEVVLGLVQTKSDEDPKKNLDRTITRIEEAAKSGAQIVCLQELFRSRYFCQVNDKKFFELAEAMPNSTTEILGKIAKEKRIVIVASLFEKSGPDYFNTACVLDADGRFLGKYRKIHIPDDPRNYYSEMFYFKPGDLGLNTFETRYAKIGVQVCWDQWFPEGARSLALQGSQILFYPTAIGWQVKGQEELGKAEYDAWVTVQRGHAISNTVFVAATNRTGVEDHLNFWGGSFVADPLGRVLGKASHDQEENLIVACDLGRLDEVRKDWPFLTCRRSDAYSLL